MKRKIAVFLSVVMAMSPMTIFASSTSELNNKGIKITDDTLLLESTWSGIDNVETAYRTNKGEAEFKNITKGTTLKINVNGNISIGDQFKVDLENGAWFFRNAEDTRLDNIMSRVNDFSRLQALMINLLVANKKSANTGFGDALLEIQKIVEKKSIPITWGTYPKRDKIYRPAEDGSTNTDKYLYLLNDSGDTWKWSDELKSITESYPTHQAPSSSSVESSVKALDAETLGIINRSEFGTSKIYEKPSSTYDKNKGIWIPNSESEQKGYYLRYPDSVDGTGIVSKVKNIEDALKSITDIKESHKENAKEIKDIYIEAYDQYNTYDDGYNRYTYNIIIELKEKDKDRGDGNDNKKIKIDENIRREDADALVERIEKKIDSGYKYLPDDWEKEGKEFDDKKAVVKLYSGTTENPAVAELPYMMQVDSSNKSATVTILADYTARSSADVFLNIPLVAIVEDNATISIDSSLSSISSDKITFASLEEGTKLPNKENEDQEETTQPTNVTVKVGSKTVTLGNGKTIEMDTEVFIDDVSQSIMVPVRFISEALGIPKEDIIYDEKIEIVKENYKGTEYDEKIKTATVKVKYKGKEFMLTIGSSILILNGETIDMTTGDFEVRALNKDERAFLPLRWLANALDVYVEWDDNTKTAVYDPLRKAVIVD